MTSDLKTQVREYTEFFVSTVEPVGLNEILDHLVGDDSVHPIGPMVADRPRGLRVALLAAAVILIVVGGVTWLIRFGGDVAPVEEPSVTTTLREEPSTTTTALQVTPTTQPEATVPAGNPLLRPLFARAACGEPGAVAEWAQTRMSSFEDLGEWVAASIEAVADQIPLYIDESITCFDAIRFANGAVAWSGVASDGELVARAVVRPSDGDITTYVDYDALQAAGGEYHQDAIGSGQAFTGWVVAGGIEAAVTAPGGFRHLIMEIPGYELATDAEFQLAAAPLLAQLAMSTIEVMPGATQPRRLPDGYGLCTGSVRLNPVPGIDVNGRPVDGMVLTFCNSDGETFRMIDWFAVYHADDPLPDLPGGPTVPLEAGVSYQAWQNSDSGETRWYAAVRVPYTGQWILVEGAPEMTLDDMTTVISSIPRLDPEFLQPATGANDLRGRYSAEWVTALVEALGAINADVQELGAEEGLPPDPGRNIDVYFEHDLLAPMNGALGFSLHSEVDPGFLFLEPPPGGHVESNIIGGVTLVTAVGPEGWAYQATARCGGIDIYLRLEFAGPISGAPEVVYVDDPVHELAANLIELMDC